MGYRFKKFLCLWLKYVNRCLAICVIVGGVSVAIDQAITVYGIGYVLVALFAFNVLGFAGLAAHIKVYDS